MKPLKFIGSSEDDLAAYVATPLLFGWLSLASFIGTQVFRFVQSPA